MIVSGYPWAVRACLNQTISREGSFFDYVVVYVAAQRLDGDWNGDSLYVLNGGGDESKKSWFMRIGNVELSKYCGLSEILISCAVFVTSEPSRTWPFGYPFRVSVMNSLTGTDDAPLGLVLKYTLMEFIKAPFVYVA